jgi:leucyl aminopeptidase (aminopeptidase T)
MGRRFTEAAAVAVERLGLEGGEALLVLANADGAIVDALAEAARARGGRAQTLVFPALTRHGEEPPPEVAEALLQADAAAIVTRFSLSHTRARVAATRRGVRIASMPGITAETFERTLPIDYAELERAGDALAARLTAAERCRITAPGGTDVVLSLAGREGRNDDGDLRAAGAFGNLPAGEAYVAPVETAGEGTIVFDGSLGGWGSLAEPLALSLACGRVVDADGSAAAAWLLETLDAGGPNGRAVAELGIGTNPAASITGLILEDEKAAGTAHIAFGTSIGIGGANEASVHLDGLVLDPTIELDGVVVVQDGRRLEP